MSEKSKEYSRRYYEKNRAKILARNTAYNKENAEKIAGYNKEYRTLRKDHIVELKRKRREISPEKFVWTNYVRHKEFNERRRDLYARTKAQHIFKILVRDRGVSPNAAPAWLTERHWEMMNAMYTEAHRGGLTVDHVHPFNGKNSCGLHVPWNMQFLSLSENSRKSNKPPCDITPHRRVT